jgi:hypothetical protein
MARKREERYEDASLMAHELRALHLQPPAPPILPETSLPSYMQYRAQREGRPIRPPKRPQVQRPRFLDLEDTQLPANEPLVQSPAPSLKGQPQENIRYEASPTENTAEQEELDEISLSTAPTGPLAAQSDQDAPAQASKQNGQSDAQNPASRRKLWRQLQRFFKT